MKNRMKLLKNCAYVSTFLFLVFFGLYIYTLTVSPNPWKSYITIGNSNPVTTINPDSPSKKTYAFYPHVIRIALEKSNATDMPGCYSVFFNQDMPYELNVTFAFSDSDKMVVKNYFHGYGIELGSGTHSTRMLGCSESDRTSLAEFTGYGILFTHISHTVNIEQNWWTLMISLWYPIILFAILPAIFLVKKLRNRKSASVKDQAIEK